VGDQIRASCRQFLRQGGGIEDVDDDRLSPRGAQHSGLSRRAGCPNDVVPPGEQEGHEPRTERRAASLFLAEAAGARF